MPDQSSAASEHAILQEITAPLETLPEDPLALVEADFPTVMRGYDRHAVDDYVEQMTRLVAELHATRSPEAAVRRALERVGDQISGVLQRAHQTAEQITAQSRAEAEDRLERARREGASLIESAERRVRELDADADRVWAERHRIISDAEALAGELLAVARDAAERFPAEEMRPAPITDHFAEQEKARAMVEQPEPVEEPDAVEEPEASAAVEEPEEPAAVEEPEEPAAVEEPEQPAAVEEPEPEEEPEAEEEPEPDAEAEPEAVQPPGPVEDPTEPIDPTQSYSLSFDEESTRIIPPASDAAQRRREG